MNATAPSVVAPHIAAARDFTRHLADLLRKEQGAMVNFLLALAECDGRRLWADLGYASLFDFLHRELGLSKSAAFYRKTAVALVQRYPEIADALADGRLCMTSVAEIAKVITPANVDEILPRFFHRSSREAKEVAAEIAPDAAPPRREVISMVRASAPAVHAVVERNAVLAPEPEGERRQSQPRADTIAAPEPTVLGSPPSRRDDIQFLTASLRRLHFTVTKQWMEKLDRAKAALSHSIPSGSAEEVLEAALDALLEREANWRVRDGRGSSETPPQGSPGSRPARGADPGRAEVPGEAARRNDLWIEGAGPVRSRRARLPGRPDDDRERTNSLRLA